MKNPTLKIMPLLGLLMFALPSYAETKECQWTVWVNGVVPDKGQIILSVFNSEEDFLKKPQRNVVQQVSTEAQIQFDVEGL